MPKFNGAVFTIGSFDGVHAGHRELLKQVLKKAKNDNVPSVVMSFSPHPREVLDTDNSKIALLNTLKEKSILLEQLGIDYLLVVPFTREFSEVSYDSFLRDYLIGLLGVTTLVVGHGHHFGHNQQGSFSSVKELMREYDFGILEVPKKSVNYHKVSSTVIRNLIVNGNMSLAEKCLTRPYFMVVKSIGGGFLEIEDERKLLPPNGKYKVYLEFIGSEGKLAFCHELIIKNSTLRLLDSENMGKDLEFILNFV